jgi:hypothetical protein
VALVRHELRSVSGWEAEDIVKELPPGLNPLYQRMLDQIQSLRYAKLYKDILAVISVIRRPITLDKIDILS